MKTIIQKMEHHEEETARLAAQIWQSGGLVAFPTETVYGLGGNGLDADASKKIYAAKNRPSDNPLILHIADREQLDELVSEINPWAEALMEAFWPGPLTMIFPKSKLVPYETTGGLDTVAIRMPSHPMARKLLEMVRLPIAAPSANLSGRPSPTTAEDVTEDMDGRIDMIVDGGDVGIGVESTILDVTGVHPVLLRPGFITVEMIEKLLGPIDTDQAVYRPVSAEVRPKAPGMKYRHYAPRAAMQLVEGRSEDVVSYINGQIENAPEKKIGVLATEENLSSYKGAAAICSVGHRSSQEEIAHNLFRVLREFDRTDVEFIYSESFSDEGEGMAIMNRLRKAAGHNIKKVSS